MEVVIPVISRKKTLKKVISPSSSATEEPADDDSDSKAPRARKKRAAARKIAIIISDDENEIDSASDFEDDGDDEPPSRASKKASKLPSRKRSSKAKPPPSSDYDDSSAEETPDDDDESESAPTDDDEQSIPRSKAKPRAKINGKKSQTASENEEYEDEDMDVEEPTSQSTGQNKSKKRKLDENDKRPAKKQKRREDSDPWKLESAAVKKDWTKMKAPPLEMFHFARKVVDEYTYLDGKVHSLVTNLTAERHWVLSGTPPIHDFGALKTIAAFLNLHLGVDDDAEGKSAEVKKRRREQTGKTISVLLLKRTSDFVVAVEKFHSFREVHSLEWHAHRHELGQIFLDRFVRQVMHVIFQLGHC